MEVTVRMRNLDRPIDLFLLFVSRWQKSVLADFTSLPPRRRLHTICITLALSPPRVASRPKRTLRCRLWSLRGRNPVDWMSRLRTEVRLPQGVVEVVEMEIVYLIDG